MRKIVCSIILFLFLSQYSCLFAIDKEHSIFGKILSAESMFGVENVVVRLYSMSDLGLLDGCLSDTLGEFSLNYSGASGVVLLKFNHLLFHTLELEINLDTCHFPLRLKNVYLSLKSYKINNVDVVGNKFMSKKGRDVFVVNDSLIQKSSDVFDIIREIPSFEVEGNGSISVDGSKRILIYLDKKEISLKELKGIDPKMIMRIETLKNPSAKYLFEGIERTVNIVTRKVETAYNFYVNPVLDLKSRFNNSSFTFDFQRRSVRIFVIGNYWLRDIPANYNESTLNRDYVVERFLSGEVNAREQDYELWSGIDIMRDKMNINFTWYYSCYPYSQEQKLKSIDPYLKLDSEDIRRRESDMLTRKYSFLYDQVVTPNTKVKFEGDFYSYVNSNEENRFDLKNQILSKQNAREKKSAICLSTEIQHDISDQFMVSSGASWYASEIDFFNWANDNPESFRYKKVQKKVWSEIFCTIIDKWQISGGINISNFGYTLRDHKTKQWNALEIALLSFIPNNRNKFVVQYSNGLEEPKLRQLDPYQYFLGENTYEQGNPELKNTKNYKISFKYTYRSANDYFVLNPFRNDYKNVITAMFDYGPGGEVVKTYNNLLFKRDLGGLVYVRKAVLNKTFFFTANLLFKHINFYKDGEKIKQHDNFQLRGTISYSKADYNSSISFSLPYQKTGAYEELKMPGYINLFFQKKIFQKRGSCGINMLKSIKNVENHRVEINGQTIEKQVERKIDYLSFFIRYRISSVKEVRKIERDYNWDNDK
ncbi:hypothetical protein MNBD_BACTEROID01-1384 [hydrothermal vent metagenome]|uniref:Outer membrane protein beta-barrel domain-containing protein n=1 Tax=hydrothermal vent metagenome TaxID=652676 RepID=A0A3B0U169_9ZZZZ